MLAKLMRISHPLPSWKKISNQADGEENKKSKKFNGNTFCDKFTLIVSHVVFAYGLFK